MKGWETMTVYSPPAWLAGIFQANPRLLSVICEYPEDTVSPLGPLISMYAVRSELIAALPEAGFGV